ncbi:MAG: ornithine carbamoyltransferase [Planctomycetota bacterium]|nr:ornithine carbamoyltransferase [Planctomycetota bacterium]MCX8040239.1 ornithine carbamoyltransferase [Planctomycetota bacterium]MDW8372466.1 ornithine carbamoyltransferase [Planctomycetota bacterium]
MRHLLSLADLSPAEFLGLLELAAYLKERWRQGVIERALAGATLAMIFEKPSLRTRLSFEVAMEQLGGRGIYIRGEEIGIGQREAIQDIARVLSRYHQGIMARVFRQQTVVDLARYGSVPVINGLSDEGHPCQVLADFLTIREHCGAVAGLTIAFIGDANNVARSLAQACILAGSRLVVASPPGYAFTEADRAAFGAQWGTAVRQLHDPAEAARGADILYTDVWTSMGQEREQAARRAAFAGFCIDERLMALAPRAKIMHCLPAHRGEEISDAALESPQSIVFDQAENRLHAQKAVLRVLLARDGAALLG